MTVLLICLYLKDIGEQKKVLDVLGLYVLFFFGNWCISKLEKSLSYGARRFASLALTTFVGFTTIYWFAIFPVYFRYTVAVYYIGSALAFLCLISGVSGIAYAYKLHDYVVGHTIFFMIGVLTTLQVFNASKCL